MSLQSIWWSYTGFDKCPLVGRYRDNKAIRDGRPRPPRHQVGWDIPLHFDTNPESLRPFVPEIWPNNVFNLSATYDLDLWPKILKIFVSHGVPIRNMYAKFHSDRLRNGWDITLWNFAKTRTNKHTNTQTHKQTNTQTDMGITIPRPPPMGGEVTTCILNTDVWLLVKINHLIQHIVPQITTLASIVVIVINVRFQCMAHSWTILTIYRITQCLKFSGTYLHCRKLLDATNDPGMHVMWIYPHDNMKRSHALLTPINSIL